MNATVTLKQGIAQAFGIDGRKLPEFNSSKPLKEAREWLDREGIEYRYEKGQFGVGLVAFVRGAGSPQYMVVTDESEVNTPGNAPLALLAPKSKSQSRRINASQAAKVEGDDVESAPTITNSPENEADSETTVTEPEKPKRRGLRRK